MGNKLRPAAVVPPPAVAEGVAIDIHQAQPNVLFDPSSDGWDVVQRTFDCNIWRNRDTSVEIQEYRIVANDQFQFLDYQKSFRLRFNSPTLVSSVFFKDQTTSQLCAKYYKGNLYLERLPLRLSDIDEIPYPDVLHLYSQCFKGYAQLYDAMGYFDILEQMICINSAGEVKVWLNKNLDKYIPPVSYHNGTEREMVLKVVRLITQNTNLTTLPDRISDWIVRSDPYTFKDAFNSLEGFASRYNTNIPANLNCVLNFIRLKYVQEEEQVYDAPPIDADFNLPPPEVDTDALNLLIAGGSQPFFEKNQQFDIPIPPTQNAGSFPIAIQQPATTTTTRKIISQSIFQHCPQKGGKRRRILRHKQQPVLYSNIINDQTSGRIPMSSFVGVQNFSQNKNNFNHQPIHPLQSNVYSSQNPFKSVLQKLKISNHYQPKTVPVAYESYHRAQKDSVPLSSYHHEPYISHSESVSTHKHASYNSYESPKVISGGGLITNSFTPNSLSHDYAAKVTTQASKYPIYDKYAAYNSLDQGKTSPQILAYIRCFKQTTPLNSGPSYETNYELSNNLGSSIYRINQHLSSKENPYKYEPTATILSQTQNGAVYKDVGNTSQLVDTYSRNNVTQSVSNRVEIIEETIIQKKSVYREQVSTRPLENYQGMINVDQQIQKDLKKFRSSKASKASKASRVSQYK